MKSRPGLIIELSDDNGNIGLGEIWCNFPSNSASYKFQLFKDIFANKLLNKNINEPGSILTIFDDIKTIFIQADELGIFNSILSALNCAIWDLFAQKKKLPLNKLINKNSKNKMKVYASGINPSDSLKSINLGRKKGIKAFKFKIGFNNTLDLNFIKKINNNISIDEFYMFDVNQGWKINDAKKFINKLSKFSIHWVEEPISALTDQDIYLKFIKSSKLPIALGENVNDKDQFSKFLSNKYVKYIQPDLTKYGGISMLDKYFKSKHKNKIYLHFLGSGVGLVTSAHVMSAINENGYLEMDLNNNPLRDSLFTQEIQVSNGNILLNDLPGIGFKLNKKIIKKYQVDFFTI